MQLLLDLMSLIGKIYINMLAKDACIMVNEVKEFETKVINLIENKNLLNLKKMPLLFQILFLSRG